MFVLFFAFGGITSLNDVLIPKLKELFTLTYGEVMLVQFAFFAAYFIISIPAAALVRRIGYMRAAVAGLLIMTAGCVVVHTGLVARLVRLVSAGAVRAGGRHHHRPGCGQSADFHAGKAGDRQQPPDLRAGLQLARHHHIPLVGSILILGSLANSRSEDAFRRRARCFPHRRDAASSCIPMSGLRSALALIAAAVWWRRKALVEPPASHTPILRAFNLLTRPRFAFGTLCIFLYVGGEVAIGSLIVNYLMQPNTLGLGAEAAGKHIQFYWGGAMVGRFIGSDVLRLFSPGKVLAASRAR